jgi:RNA polymerase sigma factor (sigma-70 family)
MDDATLVEAARAGDGTAWAAIYDRYADRLHDHCHRLLRDRDEAADALHDAFIAAARHLGQLRDPSRLRPWLYSICRHEALRRARRRGRVELTDEIDDMRAVDVDLDRGTSAAELQELVWAAAAGLGDRDRALLDLSLRQGLEGQDLADAMGVSLSASYVLMSRLRDQVERSLGALLIARLGRDDCTELASILDGWDGRFTPLLRKRVARHVDRCETCSDRRSAVLSPAALLAAAPLVPAPTDLRDRVLTAVASDQPGPAIRFTDEGFAVPARAPGRRRTWWAATAAGFVLLVAAGVVAAVGGDDPVDGDLAAIEAPSSTGAPEPALTTTTAPSTSDPTTTTTTTAAPTTTLPVVDPPEQPAGPTATTSPPIATPPPPHRGDQPPVIGPITVSPTRIQTSCNPDNDSALASATVTDDVGVAAVVLSWDGEPGSGSTPMVLRDGRYWARLPAEPASQIGELTYTVTATDTAGSAARRSGTLPVDPCPG